MMRKEFWKDIEAYEGYQASNYGRVRSLKFGKEIILKLSTHRQGYLHVGLYKNGKQSYRFVHILVAKLFIPNPENKPEVNHKKGIKTDNRAWMLEWMTSSENIKHNFKIGLRSSKGESNNFSKLTNAKILEIRQLKEKYKQTEIAKLYNVSKSTINKILKNKNWKHIIYEKTTN